MSSDSFVPIDKLAKHFSVSISTIRAWIRQGKIPRNTFIKLGNTYRFNIPAITAVLVGSNEPPDKDAPVQLEFDFDNDNDI